LSETSWDIDRARQSKKHVPGRGALVALGSAAALAGLAAAVNWRAGEVERQYPPIGAFITVRGVSLHFIEEGSGPPIVLLHGNASLLQDMQLSLVPLLARKHRVIVFDRPGFGYSERPKSRVWGPEAQADLIAAALTALGVERAVFYGHSWGTVVAVSLALLHPQLVAGALIASGYYFPQRRLDSALASINAMPVIGPITRNTTAPLTGAVLGRGLVKASFAPNPVPPTYEQFPAELALRPLSIRAAAEDAATLRDWTIRTEPHYPRIRPPLVIAAGASDQLIDYRKHSLPLHQRVPGSRFYLFPETGHMVHHVHTEEIADILDDLATKTLTQAAAEKPE
jgi:pimeloyl-ACP methyl ester carboxylesterase